MCYTTFSVGLKDMETIQQMTYDFDDRHTLDDLKEQLQEDVLTWTAGLEASLTNPCNYTVSDMGPVWNRDDNDVTRLCDIIIDRVNEYKMFEAAEAVGNVVDGEIYDFGPEC